MVFDSIFFFLTLVPFLIFYFLAKNWSYLTAKVWIILYSFFFYGMWNPLFLIPLAATILIDFYCAQAIQAYPERKKLFLLLSLVSNLGMLGFFKYYGFFVHEFSGLLALFNVQWTPPLLEVLLPVGISFYVFHTLSYTIDVYQGHLRARKSILDVALSIAFFPLLVAGPIVRAHHLLPQFEKEPTVKSTDFASGIFRIGFGLFLKCVIADNVASRVNFLFDNWHSNGVAQNWAAALLFGVQIHADFSGYSHVAIGLARLMGFHIPENFLSPYASLGFTDFWRRWHISLSTWLRDYLFFSLGGIRTGKARLYANMMITMLLGGLWHGASAMFILWGGLHGFFLCVERLWQSRRAKQAKMARGTHPGRAQPPRAVTTFLLIAVTYVAVSITWIPFRSRTFEQCMTMLKGLFAGRIKLGGIVGLTDFAIAGVIFLFHYFSRKADVLALLDERPVYRSILLTLFLVALYFFSGSRNEFIYFQF